MKKLLILLFFVISFSADAQLMIQRMWMKDYLTTLQTAQTAGDGIPTLEQRKKHNRIIIRLAKVGLWQKYDVFYMFIQNSGDTDFARYNWKDAANFKITVNGSPTYSGTDGFDGNGSSAYLETGWAPSAGVNFTQNSANVFAYTPDDIAETGVLYGVDGTSANTQRTSLNPENASNLVGWTINGTAIASVNNSSSAGFYQMARVVSTAVDVQENNVNLQSVANTSQTRSARTMTLLAFKSAPSDAVVSFTTRKIWCWGASSGLNTTEMSNEYTIITDFMTSP